MIEQNVVNRLKCGVWVGAGGSTGRGGDLTNDVDDNSDGQALFVQSSGGGGGWGT